MTGRAALADCRQLSPFLALLVTAEGEEIRIDITFEEVGRL